jgi:hypothetical protein
LQARFGSVRCKSSSDILWAVWEQQKAAGALDSDSRLAATCGRDHRHLPDAVHAKVPLRSRSGNKTGVPVATQSGTSDPVPEPASGGALRPQKSRR